MGISLICVFKSEPIFTLRGICKDATMDTQYKFADHIISSRISHLKYKTWFMEHTILLLEVVFIANSFQS
jgi:hypothetical protein